MEDAHGKMRRPQQMGSAGKRHPRLLPVHDVTMYTYTTMYTVHVHTFLEKEIDNWEKELHACFLKGAIFGGAWRMKGTGRKNEMTKTHYMRIARHR